MRDCGPGFEGEWAGWDWIGLGGKREVEGRVGGYLPLRAYHRIELVPLDEVGIGVSVGK